MNDKLKRFSFAEAVFNEGKRTRVHSATPELVLVSIENRVLNKKKVKRLVISIHHRMLSKLSWQAKETVDFILMGDDLMDAVVTPAPCGFRAVKTSDRDKARIRIMIPVPDDDRWNELRKPTECHDVECSEGKIAFRMPW